MAGKFNEDNVTEKMCIEVAQQAGYTYVAADQLRDDKSAVIEESLLQEALIRINGITEDEAQIVIQKEKLVYIALPRVISLPLTRTYVSSSLTRTASHSVRMEIISA